MKKHPLVIRGEKVFLSCVVGLAIPCTKSTADGGTIASEKVLKFNRSALKNMGKAKTEKVNSRYSGGEDTMIVKVGLPGSPERKIALAAQYAAIMACCEEVSPFSWKGDE